MTDKQPRRRYSLDFKREAVALCLQRKESITQIANNLGIHSIMLHRWIKETAATLLNCFDKFI